MFLGANLLLGCAGVFGSMAPSAAPRHVRQGRRALLDGLLHRYRGDVFPAWAAATESGRWSCLFLLKMLERDLEGHL